MLFNGRLAMNATEFQHQIVEELEACEVQVEDFTSDVWALVGYRWIW